MAISLAGFIPYSFQYSRFGIMLTATAAPMIPIRIAGYRIRLIFRSFSAKHRITMAAAIIAQAK